MRRPAPSLNGGETVLFAAAEGWPDDLEGPTGDHGPLDADQQECCLNCGHQRVAHQHLRRGTDCALCDCIAYRRSFIQWLREVVTRQYWR